MGRLSRPGARQPRVVVTCEHASARLPAACRCLGLKPAVLRSHVAFDDGALDLARSLAARFQSPLHEGRWSRLLVDLNRSAHHPRVVPRCTFGVEVPGNADLSREDVRQRLADYWHPYREAALVDLRRAVASPGGCLHLSAHSFTPELDGEVRAVDVGLLYDPGREQERAWAGSITQALAATAPGLRVRRNQPYRGTSDGFTSACRREFDGSHYAGLEIEMNQARLVRSTERRALVRLIIAAVAAAWSAASRGASVRSAPAGTRGTA